MTIPANLAARAHVMRPTIPAYPRRRQTPVGPGGDWPYIHPPMASSTTTEPNKVIYSMMGVTKAYDRKVVLKDIWLSYFYGAKIGVLGLNGAGKSSLLRILAGIEKEYQGQISLAPGYTTGFLS